MLDSKTLFYIYPLIVFAAVVALVPVAKFLAHKAGFLDAPGGRKRHEDAVPPIGGLVIFPVFMIITALTSADPALIWFYAALTVMVVIGALDDRYTVPARIRFPLQFVAAFLIVVPGGAQALNMGNLFGFGEFWLGIGAIPFSIIAAVLLINAVNLMDGLDGLSAGMGCHIILWMALCTFLGQDMAALLPLLIMAGALMGFLFYNMRAPWRKRASIFIGDAGSLALGLTLAWFAFTLSQKPHEVIAPVAVAWLLALPIFDTCGQFARRVSQGRHPFDADHHHFHHHFIYAGFTPGQATATILFIAFILAVIGVGGVYIGVPDYVLAYLWTALLLGHIYMSMRPTRYRRVMLRLRGKTQEPDA